MTGLADILAPDTDERMIERLLAQDIDTLAPHELALLEAALRRNDAYLKQLKDDLEKLLRAARVLLDLLDEEAKRGSRSARRARRLNPDLILLAEETWAAAGRVLPAFGALSEDEPERSWAAVAAVFRVLGPRCPPDQLPRLTVELYEAAEAFRHLQARDKGRAARASGAEERAASKAALVEAVRRIAGEMPASMALRPKGMRAVYVLNRLKKAAHQPGSAFGPYDSDPASFLRYCKRNCIDI